MAPTRLETIVFVVFLVQYLLIFLYSFRFMVGWVSSFSPLSAARVSSTYFEHTHAIIKCYALRFVI